MFKCNLCPRMCNINRDKYTGFCGVTNKIRIARAALHYYEEPCLTTNGAVGAIFFSGCNLKCIYCQNYNISHNNLGKEISIERLANIMIELQNQKAKAIDLVTPTHYVISIIKAIKIAKEKGLNIPIIYNSSGYERVETIKQLANYIDIYLPDFKYINDEIGLKYSKVSDYSKYAKESLNEMHQQIPQAIFNGNQMIKGIIVRHLVLPELEKDSKKIIKYLFDTYQDSIYLSIMNQYTPLNQVKNIKELNHKVNDKTYEKIINYAYDLGIRKAFIQEKDTAEESFIPKFDNTGV